MFSVIVEDKDLDDSSGNNLLNFSFSGAGDGYLNHFLIDPWTGVITTNHTIDREVKWYYSLTVVVQDNPLSPFDVSCVRTVSLEIQIRDENDNDPVCSFNETILLLLEDVFGPGDEFGMDILIINLSNFCFDIDIGKELPSDQSVVSDYIYSYLCLGLNALLRYAILSGNTGSAFSLDSATGELEQVAFLDRETIDRYYLEIEVRDSGPVNRIINFTREIHIMDLNDNSPMIAPEFSGKEVNESTALGTTLFEFQLLDSDINSNAQIILEASSSVFAVRPSNVSGNGKYTCICR